ncbi:MAG: NTP transferase domain-containing protein [Campylobacterales bacterium]|nr:NTP transferase domain-containing protein [Campylobacterales bacterium]
MAGGFGTRIQPLTHSVPKPMLPVVNRPMMAMIVDKLKSAGIDEIIILLYFMPEVIQEYFKDGSELGVKITYVLPDDDYGTAGALKCAEPYVQGDDVLVISGDLVCDFDLENIIRFHRLKRSKLTITLTSVENPLQFGVVIADEEGRIERFLEKPSWGEVFSDQINTGIYLLNNEIFSAIPAHANYDFSKDLFPALMAKGETLWGCLMEGYWRDVGNPDSYRSVHQEIFEGKAKFDYPTEVIEEKNGRLFYAQGVKVSSDLKIKGTVVLGEGVTIAKGCELHNCVIGEGSVIGERCKIESSVIWKNVTMGERGSIVNTVIADECVLGEKVRISQGAMIAQGCRIGKNVSFEKDVMVWPGKTIEEGAIVSSHVIWMDKYKASLFKQNSVVGRSNVELSCDIATKLAEAFGSILPVGCTVYTSRDYHKGSRMLKRAFLGGLLGTGVNVVDLQFMPKNVMRHALNIHASIGAGVHFQQSLEDASSTEISFYTADSLPLGNSMVQGVERLFFRENFRRVDVSEIGEIIDRPNLNALYLERMFSLLDRNCFKRSKMNVAVDLMYGVTSEVYPQVINALEIDNIILNAYWDDKKLSRLYLERENAKETLGGIVKNLTLDAGFMIYPNGLRLKIATEEGDVLPSYQALLAILTLADGSDEIRRVYLPAWAPDWLDGSFENLEIVHGKTDGLSAKEMNEFDLIADVNDQYIFTAFGLHSDAIFASVKILEMLAKQSLKLSWVRKRAESTYYFARHLIPCPETDKGKMMRRFSEYGKGKSVSHIEGIRIDLEPSSWVLMLPDPHDDTLHLYIQAPTLKRGEELYGEYAVLLKT